MTSAIEVLHAFDVGEDELHQVIALLRTTGRDPLDLPLGAGDRALVELAVSLTGALIEFTATCGGCGAINQLEVGPSVLPPYEPSSRWIGPGRGVREPTYADLVDLPADRATAAAMLGRRCSIGDVPADRSQDCLDAVDFALAGPIRTSCVGCGDVLEIDADLQRLALERLRAVAARVDREVHVLASAYAWDLATIEALADARRTRLADLVGQA